MGGRGGAPNAGSTATVQREPATVALAATPVDRPDIARDVQREIAAMVRVQSGDESAPVIGLRNRLPGLSRADLDATLRQMAKNKMISLVPARSSDSSEQRQAGVLLQGTYHTRVRTA